ncbi:hypothetical protein EDB81DRAFT_887621 [Dactylonectria macrodidyma]|uniref:Uncharacterized protein n=1 Tax=Dactylonectria macrodidyma TaxID=307937 RepID=A0A9P9E786_9HYPO|nr:hypothetical protein EDB81DRAFT_887621 [Dactylonectria macrodidyma]
MKVFNNSLFILAFLILAYSAFVPSTAAPASPEARAKAICGDLGILHITTLLDGVEPSGLRLYADYPMGQNRALDLRTEYLLHQWRARDDVAPYGCEGKWSWKTCGDNEQ